MNLKLTRRESEVLPMVAAGDSNAEIAKALYMTESTVKAHVANMMAKLEARNRTHLVNIAHTSGLLAAINAAGGGGRG